jgi:hypothetical protein
MQRRFILCLFIFLSLVFSACKKELIIGDRDYKTLGASAHDLLSSSNYPSLIIEISYMPGYAPDATTVNNLAFFLNTYLNKPAGIQISEQQIAASGKTSLTIDEIVQIEKRNRSAFTGDNVLAVHILITEGNFSNNDIFATSYWNTSFCLFGKPIYDNSGGAGQVTRTRLMSTILEHEMGHLMGLVDQGSPMQVNHKDAANGAHCNNINCLMYYAIEITNMIGGSINNSIPDFDANCIADLKANGGK